MGPGDLHPKFLKECASVLSKPLLILFNKSIETGELSSDLKRSIITLSFKKDDRRKPENYHPIYLTSQVIKILQKCFRRKIVDCFTKEKIMDKEQHGFLERKSCLTNLLECLDD